MHPFDWHGPILLAIRQHCDEDTIEAIRREVRIASVFHQTNTTRLLSGGWGQWRRWQASSSQRFEEVNNRWRFTCTHHYVFKALLKQRKTYGLENKFLLSKTRVSLLVDYKTGLQVRRFSLQDSYNHHYGVTLSVQCLIVKSRWLHKWPFFTHPLKEYERASLT